MPFVTFVPANKRIELAQGADLLEAAKALGIHVETPCGGRGLCGKCLVRVEAGKAEYENTGLLPEDWVRDGLILICKAKMAGEDITLRTMGGLDKEQGRFCESAEDILRLEIELLPQGAPAPLVEAKTLIVSPPAMGDGLSDADRLCRAVSEQAGAEAMEAPLSLLQALPEALRAQDGNVTLNYAPTPQGLKAVRLTPGETGRGYGIAVDIGTTTVAVQLVRMEDGVVLGAKTAYNAQVACGLDVISRINYAAKPERLKELQTKVVETINGLILNVCESSGIAVPEVIQASIAGNTTMMHLLLGILPEYIRLEPYTPAVYHIPQYRAKDFGLAIYPEGLVYCAPSVGSYVGGDITSGLLCTRLAAPADEVSLFIDIGTNGEIVLGNQDFLIGCACSAGPAFEGGGIEHGMRASKGAIERVEVNPDTGLCSVAVIGDTPAIGICGSGIISLVSGLFSTGWLDAGGRFDRSGRCPAIATDGKTACYRICEANADGQKEIYISESDIDNFIRAKAAIFSACCVMLEKVSLTFEDISRYYIAGGFGRYLDMANARTIGLIPDLPKEKFVYLGNSSLMGAYMTLVSREHREKQAELAARITYLDLSVEPDYMHQYTAALFLPHTDERLFPRHNRDC